MTSTTPTPRMRAYRLVDWQTACLVEVPRPVPGPGEVAVRVAATGLCATDLKLMAAPPGSPLPPPYTLGHEIAGWVEELGPGVTRLAAGDAVALATFSYCGDCPACRRGHTNYCTEAATGRGFGRDGGLAERVVTSARHAVPIGDLDPHDAAPLTDAAVTAYHAVGHVRAKLVPGTTALVLGAGGLGGYAIQLLRLLTPATVIAVDVTPPRLDFAAELGAHVTLAADEGNAEAVRDLTGGHGAEAVLDFVGVESAVRTAMAAVRPLGSVLLVGGGGGSVPFGHTTLPRGVDILSPTGSTVSDLHEVLTLARSGRLRIETERFALDDVEAAYEALRSGAVRSRAVVVP